MIVNANDRRVDTVATGSTPDFDFDFAILADTDIAAYWNGVAIGSLGVSMSVAGEGDEDGGTVTFSQTPDAGTIVTLLGAQPANAPSRYINVQSLPLLQIENDFARAAILAQQILEILGRVPQLVPGSMLRNIVLPDGMAGKFLRWETTTKLQNVDLGNIVPAGSLVLPVALAEGGTGAVYTSVDALAVGMGLARWKQGASLVADTTVVLANPFDGNRFTMTGDTPIEGFAVTGIAVGTIMQILFTGTPLLVNSAELQLMGAQDHTVVVQELIAFEYLGSNAWREYVRIPPIDPTNAVKFWRGDGTWQALLTTKGDLLAYGPALTRLPVGTDGQLLAADSDEDTGLLWVDPPPFATEFVSADQTVTLSTILTVAHGLGVVPKLVRVVAKCVSTELNYSADDEVPMESFKIDGALHGRPAMSVDATNVKIFQDSRFLVCNKTTGTAADITTSKWKWVVRAWA